MSRLIERLASLDRRIVGRPGDPDADEYRGDYSNWWRVCEPRARWAALVGYAFVVALAAGLPYLAFGYAANAGVVLLVGISYWPLVWHFYLRHRRRPEFQHPDSAKGG